MQKGKHSSLLPKTIHMLPPESEVTEVYKEEHRSVQGGARAGEMYMGVYTHFVSQYRRRTLQPVAGMSYSYSGIPQVTALNL